MAAQADVLICRKVCPDDNSPTSARVANLRPQRRSYRNRSSGVCGEQVQQRAAWPASIARVRGKRVASRESVCDRGRVPQPILRTACLLLVPLADRHLDLEVQLDSDPEVLRYDYGSDNRRA
jgi:hypothetical protein